MFDRRALVLWLLLASPRAAAEQCRPVEAHPCVLTLQGDERGVSESCSSAVWKSSLEFMQSEPLVDRNGDGWWESVLRIDLAREHGCSCAVVRVDYQDGWSYALNVGNSPTNDGNGGDAGTTIFDAELQLQGSSLDIFSADVAAGAAASFDHYELQLPEGGARIELEICDQRLRYRVDPASGGTPLVGAFDARGTQGLFAIGRTRSEGGLRPVSVPPHVIYVALNRVIYQPEGKPAQNRFGRGLSRLELYLKP